MRTLVKRGQVYRATNDVRSIGMAIYKAPGSGGFYCTIPKGTKIVITNNSMPGAKGVYVSPLNYKELEDIIVPPEEKKSPFYNMYVLILKFEDLDKYFVKEDMKEIKFDDDRMQKHWYNFLENK